jgi:hypothetical protein
MDLTSVDLAMKVQTSLERKALDAQATDALLLIQSATEGAKEPSGGRDDSLGNIVDTRA